MPFLTYCCYHSLPQNIRSKFFLQTCSVSDVDLKLESGSSLSKFYLSKIFSDIFETFNNKLERGPVLLCNILINLCYKASDVDIREEPGSNLNTGRSFHGVYPSFCIKLSFFSIKFH